MGLSRLLAHPGGWLLAGFAISVGDALPEIGGKNIFYYFVFFVLGYLALCSDEFIDAARRYAWLVLPIGIAGAVWRTATSSWGGSLADPLAALARVSFLGMTARWLIIVGLLGAVSRLPNRRPRALEYLAEGSYPIHILHQSVIIVVAVYVLGLDIPWAVQWVVLLAASVALTVLCYEIVRRVAWLRPLFGMRPRAGA